MVRELLQRRAATQPAPPHTLLRGLWAGEFVVLLPVNVVSVSNVPTTGATNPVEPPISVGQQLVQIAFQKTISPGGRTDGRCGHRGDRVVPLCCATRFRLADCVVLTRKRLQDNQPVYQEIRAAVCRTGRQRRSIRRHRAGNAERARRQCRRDPTEWVDPREGALETRPPVGARHAANHRSAPRRRQGHPAREFQWRFTRI